MENKYTGEQLREAAMSFFKGDVLASNVWINKYALKDDNNYLELSPSDTIDRMIREISRMEQKYPNQMSEGVIRSLLENFKYVIFGGSILFGLGNNEQMSSIGNCFFIDNSADSYGGIFNIDECAAQLMKRRGGVGLTLENLRPAGSRVNNSAHSSTGATSFMHRYSNTTREVAQDGRRGALMISMLIKHPDIKSFITKKDDRTQVTGANISVKVTDDFMEAVEKDGDYLLYWPVDVKPNVVMEDLQYNNLNLSLDGSYTMKVKAKEIWNLIVKQAHKNAEPGVLFWDQIIRESPADCYADEGFTTKGTNPCGEVPLSPFDSCRLVSINLNEFVLNPYMDNAEINLPLLEKVARCTQRMMDDIVSLEEEKVLAILDKILSDPEPMELKQVEFNLWTKVLEVLRKGRRTGLGVLGLGDMFAKLGMKYDTPEATALKEKIQKVIAVNSYKESINLAKERGCFPICNLEKEKNNPFIQRILAELTTEELNDYLAYGRRNIATMAIAPTGTLAILAKTTSGIEPVFAVTYKRKRKVNPNDKTLARPVTIDETGDAWEEYPVFHYEFIKWFGVTNPCIPDPVHYLENLPDNEIMKLVFMSPWSGSESHDVDPIEKVRSQGAIQKWVDHSISVTHNLPENIKLDEVSNIYFEAWKAGCKGCTVYREGSRDGVLITNKPKKEDEFQEHDAPKRPKEIPADYYYATVKGKKYAVIVGLLNDRPYEIFAFENPPMLKNTKGVIVKVKKGQYKFINGEFEIDSIHLAAELIEERAHTIWVSMLLRHGAPIEHICNVAKKVDDNITSFSSVVRRTLSRYLPDKETGEKCPSCENGKLIREEGCVHCDQCEYSKC